MATLIQHLSQCTATLALAWSPVSTVTAGESTSRFELESLGLMALSALDDRAIIKTSDNKLVVLKTGMTIPGTRAVITQILGDKIIVEDAVDATGAEHKQTVWIT